MAQRSGDRMWAVAAAAGLWGTSALMREPLSAVMPAPAIVFYEHLIIALCLTPWVVPAFRELARSGARTIIAMAVVGGGSSALATTLFTLAFTTGDPITPQVLQKLQPLFAILLAVALLGERLRPRFALYAVPALAGAWLLAFADPLSVTLSSAKAAALAIGAAALWAGGTVLGRLAGTTMAFMHVTTVRFCIALPVALVISLATGSSLALDPARIPMLAALALGPGLLALSLYYWGLSRTAASRATLAELTFPLVSALVGVAFLGAEPTWSQWLGGAVVLVSVTAMALARGAEAPTGVQAPPPEREAPASPAR